MPDAQNYFIKGGYRNNPIITFSDDPKSYWTDKRIENSQLFQYHVYYYASKLFRRKKHYSLLDIGSGPGTKIKHFFKSCNIKLVLIDQPGMDDIVNQFCPSANFYGKNIEHENFEFEDKFDLIICADVLEHVQNPEIVLLNIKNNLKDSGIGIISTPDRDMRRGHDNYQSPNPAHVREWNKNELKLLIENQGFEILKHINIPLRKLNSMLFYISQKFLYRKVKKSSWFATQMVVITK